MDDRLVAGIDLGSTGIKLLVLDGDGSEVLLEEIPTPWRSGPDGTTDLPASNLREAVHRLLGAAAARLAGPAPQRVGAVAIAGMGETGFLLDPGGSPVAPAYAWFDPRGAAQAEAFPASVRAEFAGRTGLPLGAQVSVAKLAHLRDGGVPLAGRYWLNLPEYVATLLGGRAAAEPSLISRTGLINQDTGRPWAAMLDALGVDAGLLPPTAQAGTDLGSVTDGFPEPFAGARIAVAGHDHLVAAEAGGPLGPGHYHVSTGTAEVLLRVVDAPLGYAARARLAELLINEVRHVVPGKHVLVAGVKTGLLLRRALQACGITDRAGRDRLDDAVMDLPYEGRCRRVVWRSPAPATDDGDLAITVRTDGVSPAEVFGAVLRHSNTEIARLVAAMDRELPPATSATLTGGWAGMRSVRRARARAAVLPAATASGRSQDTAYGAALVATRLLPAARPARAR